MGFPDVPARIDFGPEMKNVRDPVLPEKDLSADQMNLTFWQAAGAGRVLPQVILLFNPFGPSILYQGLAFDPRGVLGPIPAVVNGVGDYTFTFATTYLNEQKVAKAFTPIAAGAWPQNAGLGVNANPVVSGQTVNVRVFNAADAPLDANVVVAVWA